MIAPQTHEVAASPDVPPIRLQAKFRKCIPSSVTEISPLVDEVVQLITPALNDSADTDEHQFQVEMALREALANAIIHGNRQNASKLVHVTCDWSGVGEIILTVRDEGNGFDSRAVPDPTDQSNLLLTHGRGIRLMQALMDDVRFEENGTVVRMRKWLRRPAA